MDNIKEIRFSLYKRELTVFYENGSQTSYKGEAAIRAIYEYILEGEFFKPRMHELKTNEDEPRMMFKPRMHELGTND